MNNRHRLCRDFSQDFGSGVTKRRPDGGLQPSSARLRPSPNTGSFSIARLIHPCRSTPSMPHPERRSTGRSWIKRVSSSPAGNWLPADISRPYGHWLRNSGSTQ